MYKHHHFTYHQYKKKKKLNQLGKTDVPICRLEFGKLFYITSSQDETNEGEMS